MEMEGPWLENTLTSYFRIQREIYEYFGYKEDWEVIPIEDRTQYTWQLQGREATIGEGYGGAVRFWRTPEELASEDYYQDDIYTQRFLPKWVYRGAEYTMIVVDTHTDGNKFLAIFDNNKEKLF